MANLRNQNHSDDDVQEISPRKMLTKRKRPSEVVKIESDEEVESGLGNNRTEEEDSSDDDNFGRIRGVKDTSVNRGKSGKQQKKAKKKVSREKKMKV